MAWYAPGNAPINSTGDGNVSNPSTASLIAEILPAQLAIATQSATAGSGSPVAMRVTWLVGTNQSTVATFRLEQALSTGLGSTAIRDQTLVATPAGQSAQYVLNYVVQPGDRLRAILNSSLTGTAYAKIQAEPLL